MRISFHLALYCTSNRKFTGRSIDLQVITTAFQEDLAGCLLVRFLAVVSDISPEIVYTAPEIPPRVDEKVGLAVKGLILYRSDYACG